MEEFCFVTLIIGLSRYTIGNDNDIDDDDGDDDKGIKMERLDFLHHLYKIKMSWKEKIEIVMFMMYRMWPHSTCTECGNMHHVQNVVTLIIYRMWPHASCTECGHMHHVHNTYVAEYL
jgi:ArsR family metal-binding transcriptional regulator